MVIKKTCQIRNLLLLVKFGISYYLGGRYSIATLPNKLYFVCVTKVFRNIFMQPLNAHSNPLVLFDFDK